MGDRIDESGLNDKQHEAVLRIEGPLLIMAGAGSGKTRVITARIAHMLRTGVPARNVLALTFTNKAAREMGRRIDTATGRKNRDLVASTFHAFGVRILREHIEKLGYARYFTIYDEADKAALIKEIAEENRLELDGGSPRSIGMVLSGLKNGLIEWNEHNTRYRPLLESYQRHLRAYNAVDFDDLILLPRRILSEHSGALEEMREGFRYILVDEFQDTSSAQYELLSIIARGTGNVCVVGDDDQSIYSWRGASYANIERFERDFPDVVEIFLEQNYRSSAKILLAANGLIANNLNRKTKSLWTGRGEGEPVRIYAASDEADEARFIVDTIRSLRIRESIPLGEFGVLVRANNLTRPLEEALLQGNMPYQVSGGISFFQRKEIKDVISYLRLLANPEDNVNFLRIINLPRRGIGGKTVEAVIGLADSRSCSYYSAVSLLAQMEEPPVPRAAVPAVQEFHGLVERYRERLLHERPMAAALAELVEEIEYWGHLLSQTRDADIAKWRYGNVESLVQSLREYEESPDNLSPSLIGYLNRITLLSKEDREDDAEQQKINLMTIHAAKGLEFDTVFVAGLEKDLLPHGRSVEQGDWALEEERRLFYVAMTRAKRRLHLSHCDTRTRRGKSVETEPSPFLDELPAEHVEAMPREEYMSRDEAMDRFARLKGRFGQEQ